MEQMNLNRSNDNCLNLIRILAAFQVIYGHLVEHLELHTSEIVSYLIVYFRGVPIFLQ